MKIRNKIMSAALAVVLSFGAVVMPVGVVETAIVVSAEGYEDRVGNITAKVKGTDVTLYWDKISSATSYRVYKKTSDGKSFKKYSNCTIKEMSDGRVKCTITGLKKSTTYYFAVVPVQKTEDGDILVGKKKTVNFMTESYSTSNSSSSSDKLTYIPSPSSVCSYMSYTKSSKTTSGDDVMKIYTGEATYDNYEDYRKYLEDHGLYLQFADGNYSPASDGSIFTYVYGVYSSSKLTKFYGTIGIMYYIHEDSSTVTVTICYSDYKN